MQAFLYQVLLQWKIDFRNKGILLTYYVVPLVFFAFMGGIFTTITPDSKKTLIESMSIFSVTMGAILGTPVPISQTYGSDLKKSYQVGGIPMYVPVLTNFISSFVHLFIVSIIIYLTAPIFFNASIPQNIFKYFLVLAIFIICSLSVGVILGLIIKNTSRLTMISQLIFLPSIMVSGIMFPAKLLPKFLMIISKAFPATWGFELMNANNLDLMLLTPLLIIFIICAGISFYVLKRLQLAK